jgi:hypothetical protein
MIYFPYSGESVEIKYDDYEHKKAREYMREWGKKDRINHPEKYKERWKRYVSKNGDRMRELKRINYKNNPHVHEKEVAWRLANKDRVKKNMDAWRARNKEIIMLRSIVTNMLRRAEAQFHDGMTWDNYGSFWVVDHIVPVSWWDVGNFPQHLKEASHYSNLQPMFSRDNIVKKARFAG